ncbi:MAG: hypothetical protein AAF333_17355 [Planctomycetota bacterium]
MNRDRITQLAFLLVLIAALAGSTLLINPINAQRRDLQLTFAADSNQGDAPQYALLAAGLGSFRGVAVNALWYRAEMMKRDGQFAEANTLATWITYLQPRFPHVWSFLAWNMAYNISVETYTPQERYDWVNKGVRLLREQGIPNNPRSVRLYRELGWILFHKIGQSTDDVNWYYKGEFAREWEILLGAAPEQLQPQEVTNAFLPVAVYADLYFAVDRPGRRVAQGLDTLIESGAVRQVSDEAEALRELGIIALDQRLRRILAEVSPTNERGREALGQLLKAAADQLSRAERDATTVFLEENPGAAAAAERFREAELSIDSATMRAIGTCLMYLRFRSPEVVASLPEQLLDDKAQRALRVLLSMGDDATVAAGFREELLPFLRAKVLVEDYKMDPEKMWEYMSTYGPLDWRHPHSHSLYWSKLGVERYYDLRDNDRVDLLNTQRQALHSLQSLSDYGTVAFNPFNRPGQQIDLLPDPDFIDGYFIIVQETQAMAEDEELGARIRADAFAQGEENFLQKAVLYSYLYGNPRQAERYYKRLIDEFGDSPTNQNYGWYKLPLPEFVAMLIFDDDLGRPGMISLINSRLEQAFRSGLAAGNQRGLQVFGRNLEIAQTVHRRYNEQYGYQTGLGVGGGRLRMPPFDQMVFDAFTRYMQNPQHDLFVRINSYQTAYRLSGEVPIAAQTYRRWEQTVRDELTSYNLDPDTALPVPPNVVENVEGIDQQQGGSTIERQ